MPWHRRDRKTRKRMKLHGRRTGEVYQNAVRKHVKRGGSRNEYSDQDGIEFQAR